VVEPIRTALVGFGTGGAFFHAPMIDAEPGLRLTTIVTGNRERAAHAGASYPGATVVDSPDVLWRRADDLDLVVVTVPTPAHAGLAIEALRRGIAVVVDKPFTATSGQAREVADVARRTGTPLTVYQNRRFDGDYLTLRRLVDEGRLGRVHRMESSIDRWRPTPRSTWKDRGGSAGAGGVLYELGSHLIDQAIDLLGDVDQAYAEVGCRRARYGVDADDDVFLALRHTSGAISHLRMSELAPEPAPRFRVTGSLGTYRKDGTDPQEADLRAGRRPGTSPDWGREPSELWGVLNTGERADPVPTESGNYPEFYRRVAVALAGAGPMPVAPEHAVRVIEVIEAAYRGRDGGLVELPAAPKPT
jgi:predicted dehydrogenase